MSIVFCVALTLLVSYLLGCFNGAVVISHFIIKDDVRSHGSGNAGLTNFYRTYGAKYALGVIACDMGKTVVAGLIGDMMEEGLTNCAVITHSGIIMNMLACFGLPKRRAIEYACGFGEGFDFFSGNVRRAPLWMQKHSLEWLYRLMQDPKRLFQRYWSTNLKFIWNAAIRRK